MNDFFDITLIELLGFILSLLTLLFAFKVYRNFDVRKSHINKQLDTVLALIKEINSTLVMVKFWRKVPAFVMDTLPEDKRIKATLESWHFNFFIIGKLKNQDPKFGNVYLSHNVKQVFPFISYMYDPLLPKSIADALSQFYSPLMNFSSFEATSEKYVELSAVKVSSEKMEFHHPGHNDVYASWDNFIYYAAKVSDEMELWLKKYGSADINYNLNLEHPVF